MKGSYVLQSVLGRVLGERDVESRRRRKRAAILALLLLLFFWSSAAAAYHLITKRPISTLPGVSLVTKALPPRYVFSITGVTTPEAVAVSPDGQRVYVVESGDERLVRVFSPTGQPLGTLAVPGTRISFRLPLSVAVAQDGRVFVSDRIRAAIDMFSPEGAYIGSYRPEAVMDEPWLPLGLSFDSLSRLLVTDHREGKHRVLVFRPNEYLDLAFGEEGQAAGQFSFPYTTVVDSKGQIYVSDSNNARIEVFSAEGQPLSVLNSTDPKGGLGLPRGMALDSLERLHVVDGATHSVMVYEAASPPKFLFTFGTLGTSAGEFRYPSGIAIDKFDRIYVADRDNNLVQVWSY